VAATPDETVSGAEWETSFGERFTALARDIKLSHSVFALPFALLATFLAAGAAGRLPAVGELMLIVLCMVAARTVAMAANRLADREMDAANPRTAGRALPRGQLKPGFVLGTVLGGSALFVGLTSGFWWFYGNFWPPVLSPAVLGYLVAYSYSKRVTALCHLMLGSALAMSPLAATIAIEPTYLTAPAPWLLAGMVACWVAGFDVIYALQDLEFDRAHGVFSVPAKIGAAPALWVSRGLHALAAGLLVALAAASSQLGLFFAIAAGAAVLLLVIEHALVWRQNRERIPLAFLTINGLISLCLGGLGIVDAARLLF